MTKVNYDEVSISINKQWIYIALNIVKINTNYFVEFLKYPIDKMTKSVVICVVIFIIKIRGWCRR